MFINLIVGGDSYQGDQNLSKTLTLIDALIVHPDFLDLKTRPTQGSG